MYVSRSFRCLSAWVALAAMLVAGLVPAVSHALSSSDPFGPICTAGVDRAPLPTQPGSPTGLLLEHCLFCASHSGGPVLPSAQRPLVAAVESHSEVFLAARAASSARPWTTPAQARAPPLVS